jgi:hypothetical protein
MSFIFLIPLTAITLYESTFSSDFGRKNVWVDRWFRGEDEGAEDTPENRNPTVDDVNCRGMEISRVPFEELIKVFPNTTQVRFYLILCFLPFFLFALLIFSLYAGDIDVAFLLVVD